MQFNLMYLRTAASLAGVLALGLSGSSPAATSPKTTSVKQVVTGPVAVYWMSTSTSTGLNLTGGGGRPSMSSLMGMMTGGGNATRTLRLQLGSSQPAVGEASADHLPSDALGVGKDLPLYYKRPETQKTVASPTAERPHDYEPPKGKVLIFWGCGEHAGPNQPLVIDLSTLTQPDARMAQMMKLMTPIALDSARPPSPDAWTSYGEWPNSKSSKSLSGDSSLLGAHTIKGNYSPEIDLSLVQAQDFMDPITLTGNAKDSAGAVTLTWQPINRARGIIATAMGGNRDNTVVMWTSSQIQTSFMGMAPEYLTPNDIDRLLDRKALLPGSSTSCTVPAEVSGAIEGGMFNLTAYGEDSNMSYPPRPTDPKLAWNIQWETKIRYRTATGGILGQPMPGSGAQSGGTSESVNGSAPDKKKKKGFGIGDLIKQGAGALIPGG